MAKTLSFGWSTSLNGTVFFMQGDAGNDASREELSDALLVSLHLLISQDIFGN